MAHGYEKGSRDAKEAGSGAGERWNRKIALLNSRSRTAEWICQDLWNWDPHFFLMTKPPMSRPVLRTNLLRRPPTPLCVDVVCSVCRSSPSKATPLNG